MHMDKLSIILPMYNGEKRIKKCIRSIFAQSYQNLELILIDDGSSDNTNQMVQEVLKEPHADSIEIKYIKQENRGVASTRNHGISIATGSYITFIDQDDYILPEYCADYMKIAEKYEADIVVGGFQRIADEGMIKRTVTLEQAEWSKFVVTAPWAHIYRTEFIRTNQIEFLTTGIGEDIYFNLTAYAYTQKIEIIEKHDYMWVDNPKSVSNSKQNTINENADPMYLLESLGKRIPQRNQMGEEYTEYFFMRYIVWYFSFTVRGSGKKEVAEMYGRLMAWLKDNFPEYRKNPNRGLRYPKGDTFSIRASVWLFYLLERMGVLLPCLKLLAKK